jgi:uncharacterized membrane protein YjjP (DUF1212 family)/uncharacterized membrane protein YjjB (DUF3815 family)
VPVPEPLTPQEYPGLRAFLIHLGSDLTRAGDSVDAIQVALSTIAHVNGVIDVEIIVLPTVMLIQTSTGAAGRVELSSTNEGPLRLDQIAAVYDVSRRAQRREIAPLDGVALLDEVAAMQPLFRWPMRTFGHALLTGGLALLLQPSWQVLAACTVMGLVIGFLKLIDRPGLSILLPVIASFTVSLAVFVGSDFVPSSANPLRTLVPPLVTFLPGAVLTIATLELAADQVIAGASRLMYGIVQLLLLAFGIVAAAVLAGQPEVLTDRPFDELGWWAPWLGVLVFGLGVYVHMSAPTRAVPWILLVLYVTFAVQTVAADVFTPELSGFFGALAMTPLVFWVADAPGGPPSMVTFLPAFWLLVPGAAGLLGVTEIFGDGDHGAANLTAALAAIIAIALGVLMGSAVYRATRSGWRAIHGAFPDM